MRELKDHHNISEANAAVKIVAIPDRSGGIDRIYNLTPTTNTTGLEPILIHFQNDPVKPTGVDGITEESLLVVLIDRLMARQKSPAASRQNMLALTSCYAAFRHLDCHKHFGPQPEWVNVFDRFKCSKCGKLVVNTFDSPPGTGHWPQADGAKWCDDCGYNEYNIPRPKVAI